MKRKKGEILKNDFKYVWPKYLLYLGKASSAFTIPVILPISSNSDQKRINKRFLFVFFLHAN